MPTYEYECTGCHRHFEFFQNITESPKETCPLCGKPLKRLIGCGSGIIFRGTGFYATDYRKKENKVESSSGSCCSIDKKEKKD